MTSLNTTNQKTAPARPVLPGFLSLLSVAFITLKLCEVIDWSWWLVLAPLWIPAAVLLLLWAAVFVVMLWIEFHKRR
ncbi:MAG TPA: hypothetical protein PLA50_00925 [Bacteroidia bacterium]|nr:hypothetical protein [Bacteroidia bacterium]